MKAKTMRNICVALVAAVIVPSLIFGYFRDRHGNIHAAVVLHVFYNAGYLWLFSSAAQAG